MEAHCTARKRKATRPASSQEGVVRVEKLNCTETHEGAPHRREVQGTATRYADSMSRYIELKDSNALN